MNDERRHDFHMELWNWLAENPTQKKKDWPGWDCEEVKKLRSENRYLFEYDCFACMCRIYLAHPRACGEACPIRWRARSQSNGLYHPCDSQDNESSPYWIWVHLDVASRMCEQYERNKHLRRILAIQIAEAWGTNTGEVR